MLYCLELYSSADIKKVNPFFYKLVIVLWERSNYLAICSGSQKGSDPKWTSDMAGA